MDLLGRDVQVFPQADMRTIHPLTGLSRGRVAVVRLHLEPAVVLIQQADDLGAGVGAAGVLEECLPLERRLSKGGKLRADKIQVQGLCVHCVLPPITQDWSLQAPMPVVRGDSALSSPLACAV